MRETRGVLMDNCVHQPLSVQREREKLLEFELGRKAQRALEQGENCTPRERAHLKELIEKGRAARDEIIQANFRLVVWVAKKHVGGNHPAWVDIVAAGNEGLVIAAKHFDFRPDTRFSTYATWWVRQRIREELGENTTIRVPSHMQAQISRVQKARETLEQRGEPATTEDIAAQIGEDVTYVRDIFQMRRNMSSIASLDAPLDSGDSDAATLMELIPAKGSERLPHDVVEYLHRVIDEIEDDRARAVLKQRFGFDGGSGATLREIGADHGISRERVRQIESQVLKKFRHPRHMRRLKGMTMGGGWG